MYTNPVDCTQQFKFCGNPFRIDMYKGCDFGCLYCFANSKQMKNAGGFDEADITDLEKLFKKALETTDESKDTNVELIRQRVPLHLGGNSDPFQEREWEHGLTYKLIELTKKYDYPMTMSTKAAHIPDKYFDVLDPKLHGIQSSIMGWTDEYIRKYETDTPTAKERADFSKMLHAKGFWTAIRIQPLIDIDEAMQLVEYMGEDVSYMTVEHLKIPKDNKSIADIFSDVYMDSQFYIPKHGGRNYEIIPPIKEENFKRVAELANKNGVKIGCGDNDLHHLTQSRCCCGIDTIPGGAYDNFLKYNLTYFLTGEYDLEKIWKPKCSYAFAFNSTQQKRNPGLKSLEDWVKYYIGKNNHLVYASGKTRILSDLVPGLAIQNTLFAKKPIAVTAISEDDFEEYEE